MHSNKSSLDELRRHLFALPDGPVTETAQIERLLSEGWNGIDCGNDSGGMLAYKLHGRMESVEWMPPLLSFIIERHGGTVCGSSKAELQHWTLDLDLGTANWTRGGFRQLHPQQPKLDVQPMAAEVAKQIVEGSAVPALIWSKDRKTVRVAIGQLLPADRGTAKQTLSSRRKRLRKAIETMLEAGGWRAIRANTFTKD